jgi:putative inorganic carbon (HCO3(-)) transporter
MRSSGREPQDHVGGTDLPLLASITLVAALGFTPWVVGGAPLSLLAFRVLGLGALALASLGWMRGAQAGAWTSRAMWACAFLVTVSFLSAVTSVHRGKSLEAMLNVLAITGLFLAAALLVRGARMLRRLALLEVLAALPVAALGLAQHFRPELLPDGNPYPGRALGFFGQPNRLGGYLIAIIPLAVALCFTVQDRTLRGALLVAVLGLSLCLVATFSRGAWIGFVAGLATLALFLIRWPEIAPRPLLAAAALAALVIPGLLYAPKIWARFRPAPAETPAWNMPIDPEREGSGAMRKAIWGGALAAASQRPALGWGIGSFREAYDRSKDDTLKRLEAEGGRTADQAHSFYLETLTERGVLGLAGLLLFVGVGVAAGLAALASGSADLRLLGAGLLASTAALLAHGALEDNLSLVPHGTVFAANMGLLVAAAPASRGAGRPRRRWALAGFGTTGVAICVSFASFAGAARAESARTDLLSGRTDRAMASYDAASRLRPWDDRILVARAEAAEAAARGGRGIEALKQAEASYRSAIAVNGSDPVTRHQLARLYLAHRDVFGSEATSLALRELEAALDQNPHYAEIRNDLGVALLASGDREGAIAAFRRAGEGRSDFVDPLVNLATLALQDGNLDEARRLAGQALQRNPGSARAAALRDTLAGRTGSSIQ